MGGIDVGLGGASREVPVPGGDRLYESFPMSGYSDGGVPSVGECALLEKSGCKGEMDSSNCRPVVKPCKCISILLPFQGLDRWWGWVKSQRARAKAALDLWRAGGRWGRIKSESQHQPAEGSPRDLSAAVMRLDTSWLL